MGVNTEPKETTMPEPTAYRVQCPACATKFNVASLSERIPDHPLKADYDEGWLCHTSRAAVPAAAVIGVIYNPA